MKKTIIGLLIGLAVIVLIQDFFIKKKNNTPQQPGSYVILISFDGFRWDYANKTNTPNLDFIAKNGVKAEGLQPTFPSKTFPNHYSIATGMYPGNHGLISNNFYAPDLKNYYSYKNDMNVGNGKYYKGEPIWVTAEAQKVKTASYFWVGSEAKIKGFRPSYYKKYDHDLPYNQRVDTIVNWLQLPFSKRPRLITCYFDKTDGIGHEFGPDSPEMINAIGMLDSTLGNLMNQINQLNIKDSVNLILVSDHGMSTIDTNRIIYIENYIKRQWVDTLMGVNPFSLIYPNKGCVDSIYNSLKNIQGLKAWKKEDIPKRFHLKNSERVSAIIAVADSGYTTFSKEQIGYNAGTHGYDNRNKDMYGIFYGYGPLFKQNYNAQLLNNVDIYNLLCKMLEIRPAPNDGKSERIMKVLKK